MIYKQQPHTRKLTLSAARFMREQFLVMRNSNIKQVSSLHYNGNHHPETHGVGGCYAVPLWTVAIDGVLEDSSGSKIIRYQKEQEALGWELSATTTNTALSLEECFIDTLAPKLLAQSAEEQQRHLDNFLCAIKKFIKPYTCFGSSANQPFDYELLIANYSYSLFNTVRVDDFDRYPTGGRVAGITPGPSTIVYRITFTGIEVEFFKKILNKDYDSIIFANHSIQNEASAATARLDCCNQLATEIIAAKLVLFLNSAGQLHTLIHLNKDELEQLLVVSSNNDQLDAVMQQNLVRIDAHHDYLSYSKKYPISDKAMPADEGKPIAFNRYETKLYKKFKQHWVDLDRLREIYFALSEVIRSYSPTEHQYAHAKWILGRMEELCNSDSFDKEKMAFITLSYMRLKQSLKHPVMSREKVKQYQEQFTQLLKQLKVKTDELSQKGDEHRKEYNPKYQQVGKAAQSLYECLESAGNYFFQKPTQQRYQKFIAQCTDAINKAEPEFALHRGAWQEVHPILRGILGFLAVVFVVPALAIACYSKHGFFKTISGNYKTDSAQQLQEFKEQFTASLLPIAPN